MIRPGRTRAEFLADIDAPGPAGLDGRSSGGPGVSISGDLLSVRGFTPAQIFSTLEGPLLERFGAVPRPDILTDLLIPLKSILGNAYKHGNRRDGSKLIRVDAVLGRKGALLIVGDEGGGFDVNLALRQQAGRRDGDDCRGTGFYLMQRAGSTVSYEDCGRTALLCFRVPADRTGHSSSALPGAPRVGHPDPQAVRACLLESIPEFKSGEHHIVSFAAYSRHRSADGVCGTRYVLQVGRCDGQISGTRVFFGRLHDSEPAAEADFGNAVLLLRKDLRKGFRIPAPVAKLEEEPRFVLYEFDPWMNLWEYLTHRGNLHTIGHTVKRMGEALGRLHHADVRLPRSGNGQEAEAQSDCLESRMERSREMIHRLSSAQELRSDFSSIAGRARESGILDGQPVPVPIHGAFNWQNILYGTDAHFYLHGFEESRMSDPAIDLGSFLGDLIQFTVGLPEQASYRIFHELFVNSYNTTIEPPRSQGELLLYAILALCERVRRVAASRDGAGRVRAGLVAALDYATKAAESMKWVVVILIGQLCDFGPDLDDIPDCDMS